VAYAEWHLHVFQRVMRPKYTGLRFDFALIDHGMAGLTGLERAQRFRRIGPGLGGFSI
jgi:hypothetical protein